MAPSTLQMLGLKLGVTHRLHERNSAPTGRLWREKEWLELFLLIKCPFITFFSGNPALIFETETANF